jgi:hypothetical protein
MNRQPLRDLRVKRIANRLRRPAPRGLLWRRRPVSRNWGFDRGTPIDRFYIEAFLERHRADVRGRVLEVRDDTYTRRFGGHGVESHVLDLDPANARATVVADLADAPHLPSSAYDCFILTQTLHFIYDVRAAISAAERVLAPGGTLLATMPCVSRMSRELFDSDFWRLTPAGARHLFGDIFGPERVEISYHGNAVVAASFLMGVAAEEVRNRLLTQTDPLYPLIVTIRATKGPARGTGRASDRHEGLSARFGGDLLEGPPPTAR